MTMDLSMQDAKPHSEIFWGFKNIQGIGSSSWCTLLRKVSRTSFVTFDLPYPRRALPTTVRDFFLRVHVGQTLYCTFV